MNIVLNGIPFQYTDYGPAEGIPLVFIHGFPFGADMWNGQIQSLPRNIRAITYDLRGHGGSGSDDGQYTLEFFVDDLIALMDHLHLDQAILCGLSMGGYIALRAAERNPGRIRGLVLCNTRSEADSNEAKIRRAASMKSVKTDGLTAFVDGFLRSVFWNATMIENPQAIESIRGLMMKNTPEGICGALLALASRTDTTPSLSSIAVPVCLFAGEHDALTPPSALKSMHEKISGSEFYIVPHAAHMSNVENPGEFNRILAAFLKKHW